MRVLTSHKGGGCCHGWIIGWCFGCCKGGAALGRAWSTRGGAGRSKNSGDGEVSFSAMARCHVWVPRLSAMPSGHVWVPLLRAMTAMFGCHVGRYWW